MFAGLVFLLPATPVVASAHGGFKSSVPAKGAALDTAPREIRITFSEAVELPFARLELSGPNGTVPLRELRLGENNSRAIVAGIAKLLVAGEYNVNWQMAGPDGHPVRGTYAFSINPGALGLAVQPVDLPKAAAPAHHDPEKFPDAGRGFNAESPLYVVIRWLQFCAILVMTGAVAFYMFVLGFLKRKQTPDSPVLEPAGARTARIGMLAAYALLVVAVVRLLAQSYAMHAPRAGFAPAEMLSMIGATTWGIGWILQIIAALGALAGFALARRKSRNGWRLAAVSAAIGAFAPALSGHASSVPSLRMLAILADGIHIIGGSGWLGSLFVLLLAGIPAAMQLEKDDRGPAVAGLVNAFSPTALVFAGITASAGVFAAWLHLGTVPALWQTQYGKTLLVKLAILGIVTATGAFNFLYVKPRLGKLDGINSIRRSANIEVAVAVLVLLVTAVLVATPTAMDMAAVTASN